MIKAILFDLDDTLMLEKQSARDSVAETIKPVCPGHGINPEDFIETLFETARNLWHNMPTIDYCQQVGISSWEGLWGDFAGNHTILSRLRMIVRDYRITAWSESLRAFHLNPDGIAEELARDFPVNRRKRHILFPETREVLEKLNGHFKLALITNGTPSIQWEKIRGGKLESYFDTIIISGEFSTKKPDPVLFKAALDQMNIVAGEAIVAGDKLESDIEGANQSGIRSVLINRSKDELPERPVADFIIHDLRELLYIVQFIL